MPLTTKPRAAVVPAATDAPKLAERAPGVLRVGVVVADITTVKIPVTVVGRYLNTPADGAMHSFDVKLAGWLQKAIDRGVIGSLLGELAFVPIPRAARAQVRSELLIIGGMGEYGRFTRDDLSYLMSSVALAVRLLEYGEFATVLVGTGNQGMPPARSARAIAEGVLAAYDHFPEAEHPRRGRPSPRQRITFCTRNPDTAEVVQKELKQLQDEMRELRGGDRVDVDPLAPARRRPARAVAGQPSRPTSPNRVTIAQPTTGEVAPTTTAAATVTLEYAALTSSAVVPLREQKVQRYFLDRLPARIQSATGLRQQRMGELLTRYLIPVDFHPHIHGGESLTLVLDPMTAAIPWEMACYQRLGGPRFYGTRLNLTRQFRTVQTVAPGIAPPVNDRLNVLIIADPAGGSHALPGARKEANAVLRALGESHEAWGGQLKIRATVRVGPPGTPASSLAQVLNQVPDGIAGQPEPCDPIDILALMLNDGFDIIHFAGHGVFDPAAGRMGWVFDDDCLVTATEALKVGRVPRFVFANACHSAQLAGHTVMPTTHQMASLAEAFFAQGIENYLGTGWEVDDAAAVTFASAFYRAALGRNTDLQQLSRAAAIAREAIFGSEQDRKPSQKSTWGAYQYYGQPGARLIKIGTEE